MATSLGSYSGSSSNAVAGITTSANNDDHNNMNNNNNTCGTGGGAPTSEREEILKTLENIASDVEKRDGWGAWAKFLLEEQSSMVASRPAAAPVNQSSQSSSAAGFSSVFLNSRTMEICIASSLLNPLSDEHSKFFHTLLKSVLINTNPSQQGNGGSSTTGRTGVSSAVDGGSAAGTDPDLVDHTHARLHQISLLFQRCKKRAVEDLCGVATMDGERIEALDTFREKISNCIAASVFTLRKPKGESVGGSGDSSLGGGLLPSSMMNLQRTIPASLCIPTLATASKSMAMTSSMQSGGGGVTTPRSDLYSTTYQSSTGANETTTAGGSAPMAGSGGAEVGSFADDRSDPAGVTPRRASGGGAGFSNISNYGSGDIGLMFHHSGKKVLAASQQLQKVSRLLSNYRDCREADTQMREGLDEERMELKHVQQEITASRQTAEKNRDDLRKEYDDLLFERRRESDRVAVLVEEQESQLHLLGQEKVQLEARLRQLTKLTREAKENLGILRGRKKHYAEAAPLPSNMVQLLDKVQATEKWIKCLGDSLNCSTCGVTFVNGLEHEAAHCSAANLALQEEALNGTIGGAAEASLGVIEHQHRLVESLLHAKGQIQDIQKNLMLSATTGTPSGPGSTTTPSANMTTPRNFDTTPASTLLGSSVTSETSVGGGGGGGFSSAFSSSSPPPLSPQIAYLTKLDKEITEEAARQGIVAEEQLQYLEELGFAWTMDHLPDTLASRSLLEGIEQATITYRSLAEQLDAAGAGLPNATHAGGVGFPASGHISSSGNTPRSICGASGATPRDLGTPPVEAAPSPLAGQQGDLSASALSVTGPKEGGVKEVVASPSSGSSNAQSPKGTTTPKSTPPLHPNSQQQQQATSGNANVVPAKKSTEKDGPTPERKRGLGLPTKLRAKKRPTDVTNSGKVQRTTSSNSISDLIETQSNRSCDGGRSSTGGGFNTNNNKIATPATSSTTPGAKGPNGDPIHATQSLFPAWLQAFVKDFEEFERAALLCQQQQMQQQIQLQRQQQQQLYNQTTTTTTNSVEETSGGMSSARGDRHRQGAASVVSGATTPRSSETTRNALFQST